jgi:hypothetical protein
MSRAQECVDAFPGQRLVAQYAPTLQQVEPSERPKALWAWWWSIAKDVPQWYDLAHTAVLHQLRWSASSLSSRQRRLSSRG